MSAPDYSSQAFRYCDAYLEIIGDSVARVMSYCSNPDDVLSLTLGLNESESTYRAACSMIRNVESLIDRSGRDFIEVTARVSTSRADLLYFAVLMIVLAFFLVYSILE